MTKLTDLQKKHIIADYLECQNYREVARKHHRSPETIRNVIKENEGFGQILAQKKEENTKDILSYMEGQSGTVQRVLSKILKKIETKAEELNDKETMKDLATAYGIIVDKQYKVIELSRGMANNEQLSKVQELITKLDEEAKK